MSRVNSDRNLLFGVLALEKGMVARRRPHRGDAHLGLRTRTGRWGISSARRAGAASRSQCDLLEATISADQTGRAAGSPLEATEADAAAPDDPYATRTDFEATRPGGSWGNNFELSRSGEPSGSPGGRFRIRIPRPGRARRRSRSPATGARREVALKEIQERRADDPGSRARFLLEAEITGGLEHPGIVPVYGLGRDPDGRPYYAMRFIRGESLKEAIERLPRGRGPRARPSRRWLLRRAARPVHRRLRRDRLRPQPGRDPPRPQAGQNVMLGAVRRDPGRRLGARQDRRPARGPAERGRPRAGPMSESLGRRPSARRRSRARRSARPPTWPPSRPAATSTRSARRPTSTAWGRSSIEILTGRAPYRAGPPPSRSCRPGPR